jgi:hypothetical protein
MRAPLVPWPQGYQRLSGLLLSVPVALVLWSLRSSAEDVRAAVAGAAVLLGLPWVVPAMVLTAALSAPVYMWMHTNGPVPPVLEWLGGTLLVGAVVGVHINATLGWLWAHRDRPKPEPGIRDYIERRSETGAKQRSDDTR